MFPRWKFIAVLASMVALTISLLSPVLILRETHARNARFNQDHAALCAFKADLTNRVLDGLHFLSAHPNGIPGITGDVLRQSVRNQAKTVYSLQIHLRCDTPVLPPLPKRLPGE